MGGWGCGRCGGANPDGTAFCGHCGSPAATAEASSRPLGEHRTITALFADISGFTSLSETLDADDLHSIIAPLIARMAAIGERYGGSVAKYAGDALLVFFGAPVALEDHAVRALLVAGELHAELARAAEDLGPDAAGLELHVGVNTGSVVAGLFGDESRPDYSILGDAVNLAQRLEAAAPNGETYVGETTYLAAGDRFELESVGELTVKGKREPVKAWRLLGNRALSTLVDHHPSSLFGRDRELTAARRVLDGVRAGGGAALAICGEPGIGKSRLSVAVRSHADDLGLGWMTARCVSYGAGVPYFPILDLLREVHGIRLDDAPHVAAARLVADPDTASVPDAAATMSRALGLPTPPGTTDLGDIDPEIFRRDLHRALIAWLAARSRRQPTVLVVEDVHWADVATCSLLEEVAEAARDLPLCLLATGRPEGAGFLNDLTMRAGPQRSAALALGPLDEAGTAALATEVLGGTLSQALLPELLGRTSGNPFFVRELLAALVDAGAVAPGPDGWRVSDGHDLEAAPATIEGVLAARIDRLPASAALLLQQAAAIGRRVPLALLEGVASDDVVDVGGALTRLVEAGFLEPAAADERSDLGDEDVYVFHHALVVDVAYGRLLRRDRRQLHRRVAQAAEELWGSGDDVLDRLAHHLWLARAGVKAIEVLTRAGERSRRLFANEAAILQLERAIELAEGNPRAEGRLGTLCLELAAVEELTGRYDGALQHYGQARDRTGDAQAWRGMASVLRATGDAAAALDVLDGASLQLHPVPASLWLERARVMAAEGDFAKAAEAAGAGLAVAPPSSRDEAELLIQLLRADQASGDLDQALEHGERAWAVFAERGDLLGEVTAGRAVGLVLAELGRLDDAVANLERALRLAERLGSVDEIAGCLVNLSIAEKERGNLDVAVAHDRRAIEELQRVGHAFGVAICRVNLADKLLLCGELEEAAASCEMGLSLARSNGDAWLIAEAIDTAAAIALARDQLDEAAELAEDAAARFLKLGSEPTAARSFATAAEAWSRKGEQARAEKARARSGTLR